MPETKYTRRRHLWIETTDAHRRTCHRCHVQGTLINVSTGSVRPDGDVKCIERETKI